MKRQLATEIEITAALAALPQWTRHGRVLRASYHFASFAAAVKFTQRIAAIAEKANHHPEWTVRYRVVEVVTTTHDAGGITAADFNLARSIHVAASRATRGTRRK
ncbi:MAG TPA: 4a-hydroxytetrahydrobiopterin dehydratase [Planctomycetota bacterium]